MRPRGPLSALGLGLLRGASGRREGRRWSRCRAEREPAPGAESLPPGADHRIAAMAREGRRLDVLGRALSGSRAAILLVPAMAALVPLAAAGGGFEPKSWYPAALFAAGLLLVGVLTLRAAAPPLVATAAAALAAYAAWSYLSIIWAAQK